MPFPLFHSHLDLAHAYWSKLLNPNDWVIDATCGNGHDTLFLASQVVQGGVISIDIDPRAIAKAKDRTASLSHIHFFTQSHETFPQLASTRPIRLIVYNLGYLPGGESKEQTTQTSSTLASIKNALTLLEPGGVISITCYPGHPEGAKEQAALCELVSTLDPYEWSAFHHTRLNRLAAPSLLLLQKNIYKIN